MQKDINQAKLEVYAIIEELRQGFVARPRRRYLKSRLEKLKTRYVEKSS